MAEFSAGSIAVLFKAQTAEFIKGVEEVNKKLEHFKEGVEALGAYEAFKKIRESVIGCVEASSEAALNVRKLQAVVSSQQDVGKFQELAEQLSHVSTFSDDASMSALALLGKFNLTDQQMASMLPKIQDMAAAMGMDLPSAAAIAGKAIANGAGGLRGLGLAFTQAEKQAFDYASQADRVAMLSEKMAGKFNGLAAAAAGTGAGSMKQFDNATEELQETLGRLVESPVAGFFGGMTAVINGVTSAIENMSANTRTAIAVVGGMVVGLAAYAAGAIAVGKALTFFGGLPAILKTVGAAFSGLASTIATVVLPITVIASTILMIEGMVSRIKSGNFNSGEGIMEGIKNNFKQGLDDLKSGMSDLFASPKTEAGNMTAAMKGFDTTLTNVSQKITKLDFGKELSDVINSKKDTFADMGRSAGLDFSQHYDESGSLLEGGELEAAQGKQAIQASDAMSAMNGDLSSQKGAEIGGGMSAAAVAARATELKGTISGVDMAVAGFKGGIQQLAGRFGATGSALAGIAGKLATGDPVGAAVSLGVEMLTRTKSFGKLMAGVDKIFTSVSQLLEPLVAALVPFLDAIGSLVPVVVAMEPGLKILGYVVKKLGDGINLVIHAISGTWNNMLEGLANFVSQIPLIGDDLAGAVRDAKIKVAASPTADVVDAATKGLATSALGAKKAIDGLTQAMTNVPTGFKLEAARYNAIDGGQSATASLGATAFAPAMTALGAGTAPGVARFNAMQAAANSPAPPITIQNLNVSSNDPVSILKAAKDAVAKAQYLATGKLSAVSGTREYWGG